MNENSFRSGVFDESEGGHVMSNFRVVAWLAWLTAWTWLSRYTMDSKVPGTKGATS
jgi:hypothetical protein